MPDRQPNPYRPGFNQAPAVLAGRDEVLDAAAEALDAAALDARTPRPLILVGPRGLGKTVTLAQIGELAAQRHSWPTVHVEASRGTSLLGVLCQRLNALAVILDGDSPRPPRAKRQRLAGGKVAANVFGVGGEIELTSRAAAAPEDDLRSVLTRVMTIAVNRGAGVLVTLDEVQNATPAELSVFAGTLQEAVPEGWPLATAVAALPSLRRTRGAHALPTYLERAEWHRLAELAERDARSALVGPARLAGRPMDDAAAAVLLGLTGGYPYAIQVGGHFAWRASHGSRRITVAHARAAHERIEADLAHLFAGRWDDASPRERDYLLAVAELSARGATPNGAAVAAHLSSDTRALSYLRDRLIKKGTIYRDGLGALRFITPGMAAWILAQQ